MREDRTRFAELPPAHPFAKYLLAGIVLCEGGIEIEVRKYLASRVSRGREEVRSVRYSYHAYLAGRANILRYDNLHHEAPDEYHRHEYDLETGKERSRTLLEREQFPTLIEVVDELEHIARRAGLA